MQEHKFLSEIATKLSSNFLQVVEEDLYSVKAYLNNHLSLTKNSVGRVLGSEVFHYTLETLPWTLLSSNLISM